MVIRNMKSGRRLAVIALFAILALSAFGFAASNTVPATNAGDGNAAVSGGAVTDVSYDVDSDGDIIGMSFTYTPAVAVPGNITVVAAIDNGPGWVWSDDCVGTSPAVCSFPTPVAAALAEGLRVLSYSDN